MKKVDNYFNKFYGGFNSKPLKDIFRLIEINQDINNKDYTLKKFNIKNIYKFDFNQHLSISNFISR